MGKGVRETDQCQINVPVNASDQRIHFTAVLTVGQDAVQAKGMAPVASMLSVDKEGRTVAIVLVENALHNDL